MNTTTYFYQDKPIFGLDIGYNSFKVMQVDSRGNQPRIIGYGVGDFDSGAMKNGVIVDYESMAKSAVDLFKHRLIGDITTRRVAVAVPSARTFDRAIKLPKLNENELADAVRLEAEQYIPVPVDELYIDYEIIRQDEKEVELFAVAVPKKIINSYMVFLRLIGLEPVAIETSIGAATRVFLQSEKSDEPTVLIDFGSLSTDITIYDKTDIVTGTVAGGGDDFSSRIADKLDVSPKEAHIIKTKYGLSVSKKQREITEALKPDLDQLFKEIRRMLRYYEERYGSAHKVNQIVTMGGGANMPGLSAYMTDNLRLAVRMSDPWHNLHFAKLQPPSPAERALYVSVTGLSLLRPKEIA